MKKKISIGLIVAAAFWCCGCAAILPTQIETLPFISDSQQEQNLPSAMEVVVQGDGQTEVHSVPSDYENTLEVPIVSPETGKWDAEMSAYAYDVMPENGEYHLTEEDGNYIYERAYRSGDWSLLTEKQRTILHVIIKILSECAGYDETEKVHYIHDWLTANTVYGYSSEQYGEYGALVEHVAVCQGYAYAFKLCMDLAGIDCLTIGGSADNGEAVLSHAWNMVRIGDNWYHVDVTWDDANTYEDYGNWCHMYLNVTDAFIRQNHTYTDLVQGFHGITEIPTASDEEQYFYVKNGRLARSQEELESMFTVAWEAGERRIEICCVSFEPDALFVGRYTACSLVYQQAGEYTLLYFVIE